MAEIKTIEVVEEFYDKAFFERGKDLAYLKVKEKILKGGKHQEWYVDYLLDLGINKRKIKEILDKLCEEKILRKVKACPVFWELNKDGR